MALIEYIKNNINELGSYASLIALSITLIIFAFKLYKKIENYRETQEKYFNSLKEKIKELASSGTTSTKRQDIFMYVNETLASMRHRELQARLVVIPLYLMSFISFLATLTTILILKPSTGMIVFFSINNVFMLVCSIVIQTLINKISRYNKSFSDGYLEIVFEHINKIA